MEEPGVGHGAEAREAEDGVPDEAAPWGRGLVDSWPARPVVLEGPAEVAREDLEG